MFTVIKKETAWREVGRKGRRGEEEKATRGGDWHRHHNCLGGVWGSLPTLTQGLFWIFGVRCQWGSS